MGFLRKYAPKYWKLFGAAIVFLVVESVCDLLQPTVMAQIIDIGVANRDLQVVLNLGALMLLITAIGAVCAVGRNILSSHVAHGVGADLRLDLFTKVQRLSLDGLSQFETASLITRLTNDVTQVQHFVYRLMRLFLRAPILGLGAAAMAIYLSPKMSTVLVVVLPAAALLVALNLRTAYPYFLRVQQAVDRVNQALREYLAGVRVVKAFNRAAYERNRFEEVNQDVSTAHVQAERVMAFFRPAIILSVNLGIAAVLWFGGLSARAGTMEIGKIIAFVNYLTQMLHAIMRIFFAFSIFIRARASAERITEVFEQEDPTPQVADGYKTSLKGDISFYNVSFAYAGSTGEPILKDISFTCRPGETLGVIGSTGSGKSTLVNLIPRLYEPTAGRITIDGVDVTEWDPGHLRDQIGYVPQKSLLFTGTILDNIRWGRAGASLEEVRAAARVAQIDDFVMSLADGYDSLVGQGGVNLSGGQKQRLSIARALVKKPTVLILDDSTSALDAITEAELRSELFEFVEGVTCIIVSQRVTSIMNADKILVLDEGKIAGLGTHEELLRKCRVYQDIYYSQIGREEAV